MLSVQLSVSCLLAVHNHINLRGTIRSETSRSIQPAYKLLTSFFGSGLSTYGAEILDTILLSYRSLPHTSLRHRRVQTISPLYFYKVWALVEELLSVLDSSSSRYTFNGIPTKTWLGIVFFQRCPPNSPKMHQLNFKEPAIFFI